MSSDAVSASGPVSDGPTVLRPSRAAYGRSVRANIWIAIPLLLISLFRIGTNWWLLPFFLVVLLLTFGGVVLYFRNARVEYGGGSYTVVSMFGARRSFSASDATSVVTVTALLGAGIQGSVPQLIVLGSEASKLLRLRGQTWEVEQFTELADDLVARGVPLESIPQPITPTALQDRYPKVVRWWEAHPIAFGLLIGLAILVAILLFIVATVSFAPA